MNTSSLMRSFAISPILRNRHMTAVLGYRKMSDKHQNRAEHLVLTALQSRDPDILSAQIVDIQQLSPTVKGYTLKVSKNETDPTYRAGQWLDLFIPNVDMVGGFSMWGSPSRLEKEHVLDLAVKFSEWPPAHWLHTAATAGSNVAVRIGGDFYYEQPDGDHDVLLLAGGVGINPLASILFHVAEKMSEFFVFLDIYSQYIKIST